MYDVYGRWVYLYHPLKAKQQRDELILKSFAKPKVAYTTPYEEEKILQRKQVNLQKSLIKTARKYARLIDEIDKYGMPHQFDTAKNLDKFFQERDIK